jgi:NAD(P)-dependent dehydrogenase (short-subunit alcohol dehydrogenase family)
MPHPKMTMFTYPPTLNPSQNVNFESNGGQRSQANLHLSVPKAMDATARSNALVKIPLKRFGTAEEIADAALFLAKNEYATNCVINLDGGLSAAVCCPIW